MKNIKFQKATSRSKNDQIMSQTALKHLMNSFSKLLSDEALISSEKTQGLKSLSQSHKNDNFNQEKLFIKKLLKNAQYGTKQNFITQNEIIEFLLESSVAKNTLEEKYTNFLNKLKKIQNFNEYDLVVAANKIYGL